MVGREVREVVLLEMRVEKELHKFNRKTKLADFAEKKHAKLMLSLVTLSLLASCHHLNEQQHQAFL